MISAAIVPTDPSHLDESVAPRDDFYNYANGSWLRDNEIPADKSLYGVFVSMNDRNNEQLKVLLDKASQSSSSLVGNYYFSGMNTDKVEAEGVKPIQDLLDTIGKINSAADVAEIAARLHRQMLGDTLMEANVEADAKRSDWSVLYLSQGGLGMPDRDYYLVDDEEKRKITAKYLEHIAKMLELAHITSNSDEAQTMAQQVYDLEIVLAKASLTMVERRDVHRVYNKLTFTEIEKLAPNFPWSTFFSTLGSFDLGEYAIVNHPPFFTALSDLLSGNHPAGTWNHFKAYFRYHLLSSMAPSLDNSFVMERFNFSDAALSGTKEITLRWKRVLGQVGRYLDDSLSEMYVKKHFTPQAKTNIHELVLYIIEVFKTRLQALPWMSEATKVKAMEKLANFKSKVGYPDKWTDYTDLQGKISRDTHYATNRRVAGAFYFTRMMKRANKATDTNVWEMPAFMVNAYFHPMRNEIVFPAAILQPPMYFAPTEDMPYGDVAANFGGIGAVIGHEITHGYDDQGSQFDGRGELANWWTAEDTANFVARTKVIVEQYNGYKFFDQPLNGSLTQGENVADVGGLSIGYGAFKKWQKSHPDVKLPQHPKGPRFLQEQRLFLAWAQVWCNLIRKEEALRRLVIDPHSPGVWRVNGTLANLTEFYTTWGVQPGDKMYLEKDKRVAIWNFETI